MTIKIVQWMFLFLLPIGISLVYAQEIVISGADCEWGVNLQISEQLTTIGSVVKPRVVVQYSNSIYTSTLNEVPDSFTNLASELTPARRLIINQAGSTYKAALIFPEGSPIVAAVEGQANTPEVFALYQNYPNPFNSSTEIGFSLPKTSYLTLEIFNALGQRAAILVDEKREAGSYRVVWDGSGFPSGVYFYRMQAGNFVQTKKLILLR